jgi:hypothetical protein
MMDTNKMQNLIQTLRRGLDRIENNQCENAVDLEKTLRVMMSSVCVSAADTVKKSLNSARAQ